MTVQLIRRAALATLLGATLASAEAHTTLSDAGLASTLPIAVSIAAPVMLLSAGTILTVVAVEATSTGAVWILERASDGARAGVRLSGQAAGAVSLAAGSAVLVTAMSTGWLLSAAGHALAFIPNQIGEALLHNERITR